MKPTQEQVIVWGREAGFRLEQPLDSEGLRPGVYFPNGSLVKLLHVACALAYEAGRKDENEACANLVVQCSWNVKGAENALLVDSCAAAIRARREQ